MVAYNESLNKIFLWGSNKQGQIDVFKKEQTYPKPKGLSFGAKVESFKVVARGDVCLFFCDAEINQEDLEMNRVPREDILNVIHELGSRLTRKVQFVEPAHQENEQRALGAKDEAGAVSDQGAQAKAGEPKLLFNSVLQYKHGNPLQRKRV